MRVKSHTLSKIMNTSVYMFRWRRPARADNALKSIIKLIPLEGKASPDEYRCTRIPPGALNLAFDPIYLTKIEMHPAVH